MLRPAMTSPISRRKVLRSALMGSMAFSGFDVFGVEPGWLDNRHATVPIKNLGSELNGYRIALLADFHIPVAGKSFVREAIQMAMAFRPDLIAMPGDFVHGRHNRHAKMPDIRGYFEEAAAPDGVVGTLGNHDHWMGAEGVRQQIAQHTPIRLIDNQGFVVTRGASSLAIGGVGDLWEAAVLASQAFQGVPSDVPRILLSHNPDVAEQMVEEVRVDLQLSGHTHGGEIKIPFGPAPCIPSKYGQKFREGLCEGKKHRVFVTRGIATTSHGRLCCRPEVTCLTLTSLPVAT
jgi:uncharacterized protein